MRRDWELLSHDALVFEARQNDYLKDIYYLMLELIERIHTEGYTIDDFTLFYDAWWKAVYKRELNPDIGYEQTVEEMEELIDTIMQVLEKKDDDAHRIARFVKKQD